MSASGCRILALTAVESLSSSFHSPSHRSLPFLWLGFRRHTRPFSAAAAPTPDATSSSDTVETLLLADDDRIERLMKMERRLAPEGARWFPYLDLYRAGPASLVSREVVEALDPYIMASRKERIRRAVANRSYSLCLVVEGLTDFGNVSAAFRSADALGVQSVHVVMNGARKGATGPEI